MLRDNRPQERSNGNFRVWASAPLLSSEEEVELLRRWRDQRDERALNALMAAHMRLVAKIARRFLRYGLALDDLMQEGAIGLMQAAARFDPSHGTRFNTYARWWVKAAIFGYVVRNMSIVRPAVSSRCQSLLFTLARIKAKTGADRHLSNEERETLAKEIGTSTDVITAMEARVDGADVALNAALSHDSDAEAQDFLADDGPTPEDIVSDSEEAAALSLSLDKAMQALDARERMVIQQRYLLEDRATLGMVGRRLGVSKERARQIEGKAIKRLGASLRGHAAG